MIRVEAVSGLLLRLYAQESDDPRALYTTVCVVDLGLVGMLFYLIGLPLRWTSVPEIKGMSGSRFYPRYVGEIGRTLADLGIPRVRASRALGHVLPGAVEEGDYWWWDTLAAARRAESRTTSDG